MPYQKKKQKKPKQFCEHFLKINYYSNDIHHISLTIRKNRFATDGW